MTRRRWRPMVGLLMIAAGVAAMTGCGASGSPPTESASAPTSYFSPLDEYLSPQSSEATPSSAEEWQVQEGKVQELVATCMTAEGFEYIPFVYPVGDEGMGMGSEVDFDQRAWIEKYGYGVSTYDDPTAGDEQPVDPNQAIVEKMSASESEAYYLALYGDQSGMGMAVSSAVAEPAPTSGSEPAATVSADAGPADEPAQSATAVSAPASAESLPSEALDSEAMTSEALASEALASEALASEAPSSLPPIAEQGCWGEAQAEIYGDQSSGQFDGSGDEFQDMWDGMSRLWESTQKDPRLTQVSAEWASCLADAGHPGFTEPMEPANDVNERWSELNGWPAMNSEMTEPMTEMTTEPTPPPADEVAKFRADEIALAVADYDCKVKVGYDELFDSLRIEAETQFVEEHRAELERYRDSMNDGGG